MAYPPGIIIQGSILSDLRDIILEVAVNIQVVQELDIIQVLVSIPGVQGLDIIQQDNFLVLHQGSFRLEQVLVNIQEVRAQDSILVEQDTSLGDNTRVPQVVGNIREEQVLVQVNSQEQDNIQVEQEWVPIRVPAVVSIQLEEQVLEQDITQVEQVLDSTQLAELVRLVGNILEEQASELVSTQ